MDAKEITVLMVEPGRHPRVAKLHVCGKRGWLRRFAMVATALFCHPVGEWSTE